MSQIFFALCVAVRLALAPQLPAGSSVSGLVIDAETGLPLAGSHLLLVSVKDVNQKYDLQAGADGSFEFRGVPAGTYRLRASLWGYLEGDYGANRPGRLGVPLAVPPDPSSRFTLRLRHGASLSGTVRDRFGAPLPGLTVLALPAVGERARPTPRVTTDDRGHFGILDVSPGRYYIVASPRGVTRAIETSDAELGRPVVDTPIYFPGRSSVDSAELLDVDYGQVRSDLDFVVSPVPAITIVGKVARPLALERGEPAIRVGIVRTDSPAASFHPPVNVARDGSFAIHGVPPGRFVLSARTTEGLWADSELLVGERGVISGSTDLQLSDSVDVVGRLQFSSASAVKSPVSIRLRPVADQSAYRDPVNCSLGSADQFLCGRVLPGRYMVEVDSRFPWLPLSVSVGQQALSERWVDIVEAVPPLTIQMEAIGARLGGKLIDAQGRGAADYFVVVASQNPDRRRSDPTRQRLVRPDTSGWWQVENLPPGAYWVAVITDGTDEDLQDQEFLGSIEEAHPVALELRPMENRDLTLKVGTTSLSLPLISHARVLHPSAR